LEDQLRHQAFHDALTDLANRTLFADRLTHALARQERTGATVAVMVIDVDDFKVVNDSLGHEVGDALLVEVAHRLRSSVRVADSVGRLGGDEFAVLLENVTDMGPVLEATRRVLAAFETPFQLAARSLPVTISIGLAVAALDTDASSTVIRNADIAMYVAKSRGKARYVLFAPGMNLAMHDRLRLVEIHKASA
jgi:diguanylate cyclase (GGDEF)-like protein